MNYLKKDFKFIHEEFRIKLLFSDRFFHYGNKQDVGAHLKKLMSRSEIILKYVVHEFHHILENFG